MTVLEPRAPSGPVPALDLMAARAAVGPHQLYARLRATEPVCRITLPGGRTGWLVTRSSDVRQVLSDPALVKPRPTTDPASDGVDAALRRVVARALSGREVTRLARHTHDVVGHVVDALVAAGPPADLVRSYAVRVPMTVICDLLGVPEGDRADLHAWSEVAVAPDEHPLADVESARRRGARKLADLVALRRRQPAGDLTSALLAACPDGTDADIVRTLWGLVMAGHETTAALISTGMLLLLTHPEQFAALRADPALIDNAVEEILRYDGPAELAPPRVATCPVRIGEHTIPRGDVVVAALGSANRDESAHESAARFRITRARPRHVAFGHGARRCIGAMLARVEARAAIGALADRLPGLRLAVPPDEVAWRPTLSLHGLRGLPTTW